MLSVQKSGQKSQRILTSLLLLLLTDYFCFFKNSTPVSGKSVNTPVAPDLFNNASLRTVYGCNSTLFFQMTLTNFTILH